MARVRGQNGAPGNQGAGMKFDVALGKKKIAQTFTNSFVMLKNEFVKV